MLERISRFFLTNTNISVVVIVAVILTGIASYVMLPKQYNPSIVAPAFAIGVPVPAYSSADAYRSVATTLENVLSELPKIDTILSTSREGFVSVMVSFEVGTDQEDAKTRLYDRLTARSDLRPFGVQDVSIKAIDPEDLPQLSLAIVPTAAGISAEDAWLAARHAATVLRDAVKLVPNTSVIEILGGFPWDLHIVLSPGKVAARKLDLAAVVSTIKDRVSRLAVGPRETDGKTMTVLAQGVDDPESLGGIVLGGTPENRIYLRDVATIRRSPEAPSSYRFYADKTVNANAVFLAIAKTKGSNASTVMDAALAAIEGAKRYLPKDIRIVTIQNEGETARHATNELLFHLFVSIAVVVGVLVIFLGWRDALNAAFCIPLVLALVFSAAFLLGLDINRITLFALILSLGILVDDSIVMVENNARHLAAAKRTGRTALEALTDSVREVGPSVLFSTITRIMSFIAMFAVTGMMGDYMKPIPIFASIALTASLFVAFSVNPFLAARLHREDGQGGHEEGGGRWLRRYERVIASFSAQTSGAAKRRKRLRMFFWMSLGLVMALPVILDVFRVRMLPKADKDQVYLWVDLQSDATVRETRDAAKLSTDILLGSGAKLPQDLAIVESVSVAVGDRLPDDFANLFRGGSARVAPNQFSARVNLRANDERSMTSEAFVIGMRPILRSAILAKYPDARIRLLEDPPGPPTMATFEAKLKGDVDTDAADLVRFSEAVQGVVWEMAGRESIVDLVNSTEGSRMRTVVRFDSARLADRGLDAERVGRTLALAYASTPIGSLPSESWSREPRSIAIELPSKDVGDVSFLKNLAFTNARGENVVLDEVAKITIEPVEPAILSEGRERTVVLSAEIGPSSVVYPVLALYGQLGSDEFEKLGYRRTGMTPYGMTFEGADGRAYRLEWGGEWKITMDTFRDLGTAMILSLLAIYFLIVGQFGSFRTGGLVMTTFLLSFFGIMPGFSVLYLVSGEYFTATAMIGAIALGGIVVGNAILLLDAIDRALDAGLGVAEAVADGARKRVIPVMLTSLAAVLGSFVITADPVWSGLAWSIITGLSASAVLTLFFIPVFYSDHLSSRTQ